MEIRSYLIIGFGGACVGSFLFLLQQRFDKKNRFSTRAEVLWGRSYDEETKRTLERYELIPIVSFLWQKGRSRYGNKKLSYRYVIHELVCAGIAVGGITLRGFSSLSIFAIIAVSILYFLTVYDLRTHFLHTGLRQLLIAWAFVGIILTQTRISSIIFAAIFGGTMLMLYYAARWYAKYRYNKSEGLGMGDVWLSGAIGLMIPTLFVFHSIPWNTVDALNSIVLFFLGSGIRGLVFALAEYITRKQQHVAFVPGMAMSFVMLIVFLPYLLSLLH